MTGIPAQSSYRAHDLIAQDIEAYLLKHQYKSLLRFITCGSVDDGKSTLIGRLLYDSKMIFEDQLAALKADSTRIGTQGRNIDFALWSTDLPPSANRESPSTWPTVTLPPRSANLSSRIHPATTYTRNMVTGASTADLAVILVDARKGVLTQTRRHSYLAHLLGIKSIVLAVNKMDLVNYAQATFDSIAADHPASRSASASATLSQFQFQASAGDNIKFLVQQHDWDERRSLISHLETVETTPGDAQRRPFRMTVQWQLHRPNLYFRAFAGPVSHEKFDPVIRCVCCHRAECDGLQSGHNGRASSGGSRGTVRHNQPGRRGGLQPRRRAGRLGGASSRSRISSKRPWSGGREEMLPGRPYWLKLAMQLVTASVHSPKYQINVNCDGAGSPRKP